MVNIQPYNIPSRQVNELIIQPMFSDVLDAKGIVTEASDEEGDWTLMDNVTLRGRPILDLRHGQNVTKRRDATCKLIYDPVGRMTNRVITTSDLYAATENCEKEFYQGDFLDWQNAANDPVANDRFFSHIMPFLEDGVRVDTFSNRYFGDTTRQADPTGVWSWNKYDGVITWIGKYIDQGVIPASQSFNIPQGTLTPQQAFDAFTTAFNKQDGILKYLGKADKCFYVDENTYEALFEFYRQGNYVTVDQKQQGGTAIMFKGIEIRVKPWDGILAALSGGTEGHLLILTLKGNFIYGYDSAYTGGIRTATNDTAAQVFYDNYHMLWTYRIFWSAGTQIAAPQHMVVGASANIL